MVEVLVQWVHARAQGLTTLSTHYDKVRQTT